MTNPTLLLLGTPGEESLIPRLKGAVGSATVYAICKDPSTLYEITHAAKKRGITGVLTSNLTVLKKLLSQKYNYQNNRSDPKLTDYMGSLFTYDDIEFVILPPLEWMNTVSYGTHLIKRFCSKLVAPELWLATPKFSFEILTPTNEEKIFNKLNAATLVAIDIETVQENLRITHIGFTGLTIDSRGNWHTDSCVLKLDSDYALAIARKFCGQLQPPKSLQNGKYDWLYLARYNIVPYNCLWDTATMFHAWYAELPKDLGFLGAYFVREAMYWKDLSKTNDPYEYCKYNALDTYTTALVTAIWIHESPEWAKVNYLKEYPLLYPCHLCELTGIKRDENERQKAEEEFLGKIKEKEVSLSKMVGVAPAIFNTNSAPQNAALRKILGCADIKSSDEKSLNVIGNRHPINQRIVSAILEIRGWRKLASTYLCEGKELNGRILYAINPHGTDTGRCASRESAFWCGLQIQNIPRGADVKRTLIADPDFVFAECDLEQAESRDTAHIAGEENLIHAVTCGRDFHSTNASSFFGVPYESIYSDELGKTIDKALRDLAKRVNHGANYLMGAKVLVETMGEKNIWAAKRLLNLPKEFGLLQVAEYLLEQFHKTYPALRKTFYPGVTNDVMIKRMLVGATGWTRYCFGNPKDNKRDLNAYVAHVPQSLNGMVLNEAFMDVFYNIAMHPEHSKNFKLLAQIHDSILFQFRKGHEYLAQMVKEKMEIPVTVKGYDGKVRTFTVPAAIKAGPEDKGAYRWSETE